MLLLLLMLLLATRALAHGSCCSRLLPFLIALVCCSFLLLLLVAVACCCCLLIFLVARACCSCWLLLVAALVALDCCSCLLLFTQLSICTVLNWSTSGYHISVHHQLKITRCNARLTYNWREESDNFDEYTLPAITHEVFVH